MGVFVALADPAEEEVLVVLVEVVDTEELRLETDLLVLTEEDLIESDVLDESLLELVVVTLDELEGFMDVDVNDFETALRLADDTLLVELDEVFDLVLLTIFEELVVFRLLDGDDLEVDVVLKLELVFVVLADDKVGFLLLGDLVELDLIVVFVVEVFSVEDFLVVEETSFPSTQSQSERRLFALYLRNGDVVLGLLIWSVLVKQG